MAIKFYFTALCWHVNFCHHCHHKTAWCYGGDMVVLWKGLFLHVRVWAKKPQTVQMYCLRFVSCSHLFTPVHTCSRLLCGGVDFLTHFDTFWHIPAKGVRFVPIYSDMFRYNRKGGAFFCSILQYIAIYCPNYCLWRVARLFACFGMFWHILAYFSHISTYIHIISLFL